MALSPEAKRLQPGPCKEDGADPAVCSTISARNMEMVSLRIICPRYPCAGQDLNMGNPKEIMCKLRYWSISTGGMN